MACCCIFAIAAAGIGFLYLDAKISAVQSAVGSAVKDLSTLKARMTAPDTKEQLAAVTAEVEHLKATNTQLRAEVKKIRDTLEVLKARKNNVVSAQRKRR
jgi:cell division protein FtsB